MMRVHSEKFLFKQRTIIEQNSIPSEKSFKQIINWNSKKPVNHTTMIFMIITHIVACGYMNFEETFSLY